MHGHHQATALGGSPPLVAAAATPSRRPTDDPKDAQGVQVDLFVDLASGWTCWIPRWPAEGEPAADDGPVAAAPRLRGQGLVAGLLGRVAAWFGISEPSPSGGWRRVYAPRHDPSEPGMGCSPTIWGWWC